jgi:hypothetical protein
MDIKESQIDNLFLIFNREKAEKAVSRSIGAVDILINNAGIYPLTLLVEMSETEWREVIDAISPLVERNSIDEMSFYVQYVEDIFDKLSADNKNKLTVELINKTFCN